MDTYIVWVYIHVLLFVFWVGTDIGVFILGKFAQSDKYPPDIRLFSMKVALLIDRFPRVCFVLMIPVGFQMAVLSGLLPLSGPQLGGIWAAALLWLAIVFWAFARDGEPIVAKLRHVERVIQLLAVVVMTGIGLVSLTADAPVTPAWLAIKLILFAGIILMAFGLDLVAGLSNRGFEMLEKDGYSDEAQRAIKVGLDRIYAFVVVIYILALAAAFFGIAKYPL